jgi:glyoxylate/hydroxypyruvate reductase
MTFLYKADPTRGEQRAQLFAQKAPEIEFRLWPDIGDPASIRYLAAWQPPEDLARRLPNPEVVFSVGAGIDHSTCFPSAQALTIRPVGGRRMCQWYA